MGIALLVREPEKPVAEDEPARADPGTARQMAEYLEKAEPAVLEAMLHRGPLAAAAVVPPPHRRIDFFARGARDPALIARLVQSGGEGDAGGPDAARVELLKEPAGALADVRAVLAELPEEYDLERAELLKFLSEVAREDEGVRAGVEETYLHEAARPARRLEPADTVPLPQAVALREYLELEPDGAKRRQAYQAALRAQSDPGVQAVLSRLEHLVTAPQADPAAEPGGGD